MGRAPCCDKVGLKKGPWTSDEDEKLSSYINTHGHGSWRTLPQKAGLLRCGKSCRLRWTNYLRPDIKRGEFSAAEDQAIIQLHALVGNRWSAIATHLQKRTDNEIKNYWNTHLKKRLVKMGLDPVTHRPTNATESSDLHGGIFDSSDGSHGSSLFISHMAQWESARLEAEARLKKESSLRAKGLWHQETSPSSASARSWSLQDPLSADNSLHEPDSSVLMSARKDGDGGVIPSAKQSHDGRGLCKGLSMTEVFNTLQNWEYSLQGQAGLMWPESWRFLGKDGGIEGQESGSPLEQQQLCHGSPTSTLSSLDQLSSHLPLAGAHTRKLSWSDSLTTSTPTTASPSLRSCSNTTSQCFPHMATSLHSGEDPNVGDGVSNMGMQEKAMVSNTPQSRSFLDELDLVSEDDMSITRSSSNVCNLTTEDYLDCSWDMVMQDPRKEETKLQENLYF